MAVLVACGAVALWLMITEELIWGSQGALLLRGKLLFVPFLLSIYVFGRIVQVLVRREWRGLVAAYPEVEPTDRK